MNECEVEVVKEVAKKAAEFGKEIALDLAKPSAKSIGENLGLMFDGLLGWIGCWGEKQKIKHQIDVEDFKNKTMAKILAIPQENLIEPKMYIVGPVLEATKYTYEEEYFRDMFSNLLAAACDKNSAKHVHPSFIEVIKQLSPIDAKLINLFKDVNVYPMCDIQEIVSEKKIIPFRYSLFDFKEKKNIFSMEEYMELTFSLNNLDRLGLLFKNRDILYADYDYSNFKNDELYKIYEKAKENSKDKLNIIRARLELTEFGRMFRDCCIIEKIKS